MPWGFWRAYLHYVARLRHGEHAGGFHHGHSDRLAEGGHDGYGGGGWDTSHAPRQGGGGGGGWGQGGRVGEWQDGNHGGGVGSGDFRFSAQNAANFYPRPDWHARPHPSQHLAAQHGGHLHLSWEQQQQQQWQRQQLDMACGGGAFWPDHHSAGDPAQLQAGSRPLTGGQSWCHRPGADGQPGVNQTWPWDKNRFEEEEARQQQQEEARQQAEARRKRQEECLRVNRAITSSAEAGDFRAAAQHAAAGWSSGVEISSQTLGTWVERCACAGIAPLADALRVIGEARRQRGHARAGVDKGARRGGGRGGVVMDINSYTKMIQRIVCDLSTRPAVVRLLLNLAMPAGSTPVPAVPDGATEEEAADALKDAAELLASKKAGKTPALQDEDGEEEAAESDHDDDAGDDAEGGAPLFLYGCEARPDLDGEFVRTSDFDDFMESSRPVFVRSRPLAQYLGALKPPPALSSSDRGREEEGGNREQDDKGGGKDGEESVEVGREGDEAARDAAEGGKDAAEGGKDARGAGRADEQARAETLGSAPGEMDADDDGGGQAGTQETSANGVQQELVVTHGGAEGEAGGESGAAAGVGESGGAVGEAAAAGVGEAGEGGRDAAAVQVVCYFWRFSKVSVGWFLGGKFGCKKSIVAFNPSSSLSVPRKVSR